MSSNLVSVSLSFSLYLFSLVIVDQATLSLGSLDQLQMLHVQTIPLGETARSVPRLRPSTTCRGGKRVDSTVRKDEIEVYFGGVQALKKPCQ